MALIDNILAYYKLNETSGTTVNDEKGTYDLTNIGTATVNQTGKIGTSYYFDGSTPDYLQFPGGALPTSFFDGDASISMWLNPTTWNSNDHVLWGGTRDVHISWKSSTEIAFVYYDGTAHEVTANIGTGSWYHVVVTRSTVNGLKIYVNNGVPGTNPYTGTPNPGGTASTLIGYRPGQQGFNGYIDEIGIWDRELDSTEVSELYNSGLGLTYPFLAFNKTGNARIQINDNEFTKLGTSRIQINDTELVYDATARIEIEQSFTKDGIARILKQDSFTKTGSAKIAFAIEKEGNARIELTSQLTKQGTSRIQLTSQLTKNGTSRIQINDTEQVYDGVARILKQDSFTKDSQARIELTSTFTKEGNARILKNYEFTKEATSTILKTADFDKTGTSRILKNYEFTKAAKTFIRISDDFKPKISSIENIKPKLKSVETFN